jgi:nitroreductase
MDLLEAIYTRRSVRAFDPLPVPADVLRQLLSAAVQAPSGMNRQPWAFGVLTGVAAVRDLGDRAKAHLLANIADDSPLAVYRERLAQTDFQLFYGAPAAVVIYGKPEGVTTQTDCALAAQNLMLAACALGWGTCWVGFSHGYLDLPEVKAGLGVPADYRVAAPLALGRPAVPIPAVPKAPPEIVFWR